MTNEVVKFLSKEASNSGFKTYSAVFGDLHLDQETGSIKQSTGSVYGIFVESYNSPVKKLKSVKGYPKLYPVYWGKDIAPVSRLKAHVQHHKTTGNAKLRDLRQIKGKRFIFGANFRRKLSRIRGLPTFNISSS